MKTIIIFLIIAMLLFAGNANAQLKVMNSGFVGIGADPIAKLHVAGSSYIPSGNSYWINATSDNGVRLRLHNNGYDSYLDFYPDLYFRTGSSANGISQCPMYIKYGCVGINNGSPAYALDVTGIIRAYNVSPSDERLKDNIKKLTGSLDMISKLNGCSYTLKNMNNPSSGKLLGATDKKSVKDTLGNIFRMPETDSILLSRSHMGFIAQEVRKILPDVVYEDKNGMLSIDYIAFIPLLTEAIKDIKSNDSIKDLNIVQLKEENDAIKAKLTELEKKIETCCSSSKLKSASTTNDLQTNAVLYQNIPNPFTQNTEIRYFLPENIQLASLYIFNMQGTQIKSIPIQTRGNGNVIINGSELKAGMYLYSLIANDKEIDTKRMILTQ